MAGAWLIGYARLFDIDRANMRSDRRYLGVERQAETVTNVNAARRIRRRIDNQEPNK
jgi:hypothetical protein